MHFYFFSQTSKLNGTATHSQGIHLVKRLVAMGDRKKQQAEVAAFFQRFEDAQRIFLDIDERQLAVNMREKLGDWFRVVKLVKSGGGGDDALLRRAWSNIGEYYFDRQRYEQALPYFRQGGNHKVR